MDFAQSRRNEDTSYRTSHTLSVPTIKSLGFIVSEKIFIVCPSETRIIDGSHVVF